MKRLNACSVGIVAATVLALVIAGSPERAEAETIVVSPADDVQAALDGASPGDKVKFQPGVYTRTPTGPDDDAVFTVNTDNLTLQGPTDAVIDATHFEYGLLVGGGPISPAGCPATAVVGFSIDGFTFRNAEDTGLRLTAVDGFSITGGVYLDNEEYGPFPVCSRNGVIARNFASGHNDAAIYVGDDDNVEVRNNVVTDSVIGIEIENSTNAVVRNKTGRGVSRNLARPARLERATFRSATSSGEFPRIYASVGARPLLGALLGRRPVRCSRRSSTFVSPTGCTLAACHRRIGAAGLKNRR